MDALSYLGNIEDPQKSFPSTSDTPTNNLKLNMEVTSTVAGQKLPDGGYPQTGEAYCSNVNKLISILSQQESVATPDPAPAAVDLNDVMYEFRMNGAETAYDEDINNNFLMHQAESVAASRANIWSDMMASQPTPQSEELNAFDFLLKSVTAANNYLSLLTREQMLVLQYIRPGLLHELIQDVAKVRRERRVRRALPNECAFCKNNGENEERYSSHSLKDWRGRVLCPVLRAFRCPRCGATGDRAHTIKYCPENSETERAAYQMSARRRLLSSSAFGMPSSGASINSPPTTPPANMWVNFPQNI